MREPVRCEGCDATGLRALSRICPPGWFYLTTKIEGANAHDVVYTYACSKTCRDRMWCDGPGPEASPVVFMPAPPGGALPPAPERESMAPCGVGICGVGYCQIPQPCPIHGAHVRIDNTMDALTADSLAGAAELVDIVYGENDQHPDTALFIKSMIMPDRVLAVVLLINVPGAPAYINRGNIGRPVGSANVVVVPHVSNRRNGEECAWRARRRVTS